MNKVILIGNLTKDVELSYVAGSGMAVARFTMAVARPFKKDETDFINCVTFGKTAENISTYTQKGAKIAVEGSIKTGSYEGKDGTRKYTTDINCSNVEFLTKPNLNGENNSNFEKSQGTNKSDFEGGIFYEPIDEGDSPF